MLYATRVDSPLDAAVQSNRVLYRLSENTTMHDADSSLNDVEFQYVVLSMGRAGDTCAFPADSEGRILDLIGFGYAMGPSRHLMEYEFDAYIDECLQVHVETGGRAWTRIAPPTWASERP